MRKAFSLGVFERGYGTSRKKTIWIAGFVKALVELIKHHQEVHSVQIEDRRSLTAKSLASVVPGQGQ